MSDKQIEKKNHDFAVPKLHLKDMKQLIYVCQSASNKLKLDETRSPDESIHALENQLWTKIKKSYIQNT